MDRPDPTATCYATSSPRRDAARPGCGYNLRGLTTTGCPEGAHAIGLDIRRDDSAINWRAWLAPAFAWPVLILRVYTSPFVLGLFAIAAPTPGRGFWIMQGVIQWWAIATGLIAAVVLVVLLRRERRPAAPRTRRGLHALAWSLCTVFAVVHIVGMIMWRL